MSMRQLWFSNCNRFSFCLNFFQNRENDPSVCKVQIVAMTIFATPCAEMVFFCNALLRLSVYRNNISYITVPKTKLKVFICDETPNSSLVFCVTDYICSFLPRTLQSIIVINDAIQRICTNSAPCGT